MPHRFHSSLLIAAVAISVAIAASAAPAAFQPSLWSRPLPNSLPIQRQRKWQVQPLRTHAVIRHTSQADGDAAARDDDEQSPEAKAAADAVKRCYEAWNLRDMNLAASCFADKFSYDDGLYLGTINTRGDLKQHFEMTGRILPQGSVVVLDDLAADPVTGNVGARWHAERKDGTTLPLTRGCSFYGTENGLIKSGFKCAEMLVKPNKGFADNLVSSASTLTGTVSNSGVQDASGDERTASVDAGGTKSLIEQYFEAWNRRDMEAALECFADECVYATEDPVFVESFQGKDALRNHLNKNAESLPQSCRIILDDLAIDGVNGKYGVKWHLEIGGMAIPNLRGCSMYVSDLDSGLLTSGWDVTEAPVKVPRMAAGVFALPTKLGLFQ